ncbi:MAG TPA: hypothetical protein VGD45_30255 [Steroidobacter sp.]|uniref:hypothetical protein n=1 Tax=Steroidobacter sp. TaxID=1978227 RepID=UPI002ED94EE3
MMNLERCGWPALACLLLSAHANGADGADGIPRHSATLSMQGDENDNQQWWGKLALPLGDHAWVQGSLGRSELATSPASNTKMIGAAVGIAGQRLDATVDFVRRTGDNAFEQQDWAAALNWHGTRGGVGADVFLRSASGESQRTGAGGALAPSVTTTVRDSVDAKGFGLHGDFDLTPRTNVFAGAMRYRYDFSANSTTTGTDTPLSSLLGTTGSLSGAWRDQAFIDRSYRVGARYRFERAAVNAQYFHDRSANTGEGFNTTQLQAELLLGGRWLVSPTLGYSSGGDTSPTGYGGLSLGFIW